MNINQQIDYYVSLSKKHIDDYLIVVVGNAREITKDFSDYSQGTSVSSEYYALKRFRQIVTTLRAEGFEVLQYFDEMDFVHDYLSHRIRNNYYKQMIVFNFAQKGTVHGRKSFVPLFCEMNNIIHTNSDPFVTSYTREKFLWYKLLKDLTPVCQTWLYDMQQGWIDGTPAFGQKVIVKLENQCSSMGMDENCVFSYTQNHIEQLNSMANIYQSRVLVQEFISGYEVEVPFVYTPNDFFCLKPQGIKVNNSILIKDSYLDYNARGNHLFSFYNFDDEFPTISNQICANVEKIVKTMNIMGMGRIDFRLDENRNFYVTDINSNPHLIDVASPAEALRQMGFEEYSILINLIIGITISRHPN